MSIQVLQRMFEQGVLPASLSGFQIEGYGMVLAWGTTVPSDAATGYAHGCLFLDLDATGVTAWYCNIGDSDSANFNLVTVASD